MITMLADMQVGGMQVAFHIETKDPISEKSGTRARPLEEGRKRGGYETDSLNF